jgi:transcription initiation factor TFIID subunit 10
MADSIDAKPTISDPDPDPSSSSLAPVHSSSLDDASITAPPPDITTTSTLDDPPLDPKQERDLDAEIIPPTTTDTSDVAMDLNGTGDTVPASTTTALPLPGNVPSAVDPTNLPTVLEPRIPQKKDTSLREFLGKMDDYAPLIPDAVTDYYLTLAGLPPPPETDRRLARLLGLATQKFIADIASDAYQYSRIRSTNTTSNNPLTGLGGAAGFGLPPNAGDEGGGGGGGGGAGKGAASKKDAGSKAAPLGGPRSGFGGGGASAGQGRTVLTMEDLGMAVGEYGVNVKRGEFYR